MNSRVYCSVTTLLDTHSAFGVQCTTVSLAFPESSFEITVDVRSKDVTTELPIVIFCHGFRVHKDWGFIPRACAALARAGAHVVSYNGRYNGFSGAHSASYSEDVFALNTISKELEDIDVIIGSIRDGIGFFSEIAHDGRFMLAGHSRGSAIALLTSARTAGIEACALWSPVARLNRYTQRQKVLWHSRGYVRVAESERGPAFRMNVEYLEDLEKHQTEFSLTSAMSRFKGRSSIIVGEQDLATPPSEARELYAAAASHNCTYTEIAATGHTFDMSEYDAPLSAPCLEVLRQSARTFALSASVAEL